MSRYYSPNPLAYLPHPVLPVPRALRRAMAAQYARMQTASSRRSADAPLCDLRTDLRSSTRVDAGPDLVRVQWGGYLRIYPGAGRTTPTVGLGLEVELTFEEPRAVAMVHGVGDDFGATGYPETEDGWRDLLTAWAISSGGRAALRHVAAQGIWKDVAGAAWGRGAALAHPHEAPPAAWAYFPTLVTDPREWLVVILAHGTAAQREIAIRWLALVTPEAPPAPAASRRSRARR